MPPELAPGYFISVRTGLILRKKGAVVNEEMEALRKATTIEEPIVEPEPPAVTVEDLINYNRDHFDFDSVSSEFISQACNIFGGGILGTCCAVSDRLLTNMYHLVEQNTKNQQINFGCFMYSILQHAWNKERVKNAGVSNGFTRCIFEGKDETFKRKFQSLSSLTINGTYIFTWASHQAVIYKQFMQLLGATELYVGHNGRYPYDSNHEITIFIIDRVNSLPRFFEIHKDYLTQQYLTVNTQK